MFRESTRRHLSRAWEGLLSGLRAASLSPLPPCSCTRCEVPLGASADVAVTLGRSQCCHPRIARGGSSSVPKAHPGGACWQGRCLRFLISFRLTDKLGLYLQAEEGGSRIRWTTTEQRFLCQSGVLRGCAGDPHQLPALAKQSCRHSQSLVWFWTRPEEYHYIKYSCSTGFFV